MTTKCIDDRQAGRLTDGYASRHRQIGRHAFRQTDRQKDICLCLSEHLYSAYIIRQKVRPGTDVRIDRQTNEQTDE